MALFTETSSMTSKRLLPPFMFAVAGVLSAADEGNVDSAASAIPKPAVEFRVIAQKKVQTGDHAIIFNRVAPPTLPAAPVPSVATVAPLNAEQLRLQVEAERKEHKVIFLSATIYDRQVTELQWFDEAGKHHVFSNIDFNFLAGVGGFETADTDYTLIMGIGNETSENLAEANRNAAAYGLPQSAQKTLPDLSQFPQGRSSYLLAPDNAPNGSTNTFAAIDALHAYYDANSEELQKAWQEREVARLERERWLREHPPGPTPDTVINFWHIKSSLYQDGKGAQGK